MQKVLLRILSNKHKLDFYGQSVTCNSFSVSNDGGGKKI